MLYPEPFSRWLFRSMLRERDTWYARELDAAHERISRKGEAAGPSKTEGTSAIVPWVRRLGFMTEWIREPAWLAKDHTKTEKGPALTRGAAKSSGQTRAHPVPGEGGEEAFLTVDRGRPRPGYEPFSGLRTEHPSEKLTLAQAMALARERVRDYT